MQIPAMPPDEVERLAALYELNILDTSREERFDRITRLAVLLFEVPISYVALVDADRQWFKSAVGLSVSETPRDVSFCGHTILQDAPLVIVDTLEDERFSDNPMVLGDPNIRFYAGYPLSTPEGYKVGTLCLIDRRPRPFGGDDLEMFGDMATMAQDQINLLNVVQLQREVRIAKAALEKANEELTVRNAFIRKVFGRYLSDEIAETLLESPEALKLGGEKREVTVLMSDLRDFTPLSHSLSPERVVALLNTFLEAMIDVIARHGGTIDNFIGDAILVVFGVPLSKDDDAQRAVSCALDMQLAMGRVNRETRRQGLPEVSMGIGINTGEVVVGNIGSQKHMKFSVIGDAVNLAARIESFTLGGQILVSDTTRKEVADIVRIDGRLRVKVKGIDEPVSIFDIGGIGGEYDIHLPAHNS